MIINKIKIENLKAFSNEVEMVLAPNTNQIEADIENGYFRKLDNFYYSPVYSLSGGNSTGKSSFIKTINSLKDFLAPIDISDDIMFEHIFKKNTNNEKAWNYLGKMARLKAKITSNKNDKLSKMIEKHYGKVDINNIDFVRNNWSHQPVEVNLFDDKISLNAEAIYSNYLFEYKNLINKWTNTKHHTEKPSSIKIQLYDEVSQENVFVNLFDTISNKKTKLNYSVIYDSKKQDIYKRTMEYINNIKFFKFETYFLEGCTSVNNYINKSVINLIQLIKKYYVIKDNNKSIEKFISIINLADKHLAWINFKNKDDFLSGIKNFELDDGSIVEACDLSDGTVKFMQLFYTILNAMYNQENQLILIDEIDSYLHEDLVNFFKHMLYSCNSNIQLIFTSHNFDVIAKDMSPKQIFYIDNQGCNKKIVKVSSILQKGKNIEKSFKGKLIGSHPIKADLLYEIGEINVKEHTRK